MKRLYNYHIFYNQTKFTPINNSTQLKSCILTEKKYGDTKQTGEKTLNSRRTTAQLVKFHTR